MEAFKLFILLNFIFLTGSCAQLPQSSVTLSNSITDDLILMQKSHRDFINYYYDSLELQANMLIDNKYRPILIKQVIDQDVEKFKLPEKRYESLFNAIQVAFINNGSMSQSDVENAQFNAMTGMKIFYTAIDNKVEIERKKLLAPLREQRQQLIGNLDTNYANIVKKNSAITALLLSVVEVHDAQQQLYTLAGIEEDVRGNVGNKLSELADKISEIQGNINEKNSQVDDVEAAINQFKDLISN